MTEMTGDKANPDDVAPLLDLGTCLTFDEAATVQRQALQLLQGATAIDIHGGAVRQIDTAGIQLLAALMKQVRTQRLQVNWRGVSDSLLQAAQLLSLEALLGLQSEAASVRRGAADGFEGE